LLIDHFLDLYTERFGRQKTEIEPAVLQKMINYHWPGNVRELEHAIEAAMNMVEGDVLGEEHFPESLRQAWGSQPAVSQSTSALQLMSEKATTPLESDDSTLCSLKERLEAEEKHWIQRALQANRGNIKQAALSLQIPRQTLQYKIKKYNIKAKD
jgi:arginine utilization regulatory protein